jgi:uncharacterized membrane protein YhaH (DUF805 family)
VSLSMLFFCGLIVTSLASLAVVVYLHNPLQKLLVELCGNERRAEFWSAFSAVTVGVVPVIFSLACRPGTSPDMPALLAIANQLQWGLIGMVVSVLLLGWIIGRWIPRVKPKA